MVGNVGSTGNLINMISLNYQLGGKGSQGFFGVGAPPPPPSGGSGKATEDPLGMFNAVDSDSDSAISESEYNILTQGILEVTGSELSSNFLDFDSDGDGQLNGVELKSVLAEAGFAPPPPPSGQVISAYESQGGQMSDDPAEDENLLTQLLEYLENRSGNFDVTA